MLDGRRSNSGFKFDVDLRGWLVLGLIVVGLLLLIAPPALAVVALVSLVTTLGAWKLRLWLAERSPEEDEDRDRFGW